MDFAGLDTKTVVSEKTETPTLTLAEIAKSANSWEPSFKSWFGKPAPNITITDITGKRHKISDYKGKNLILNFWATWCGPCRKEIPDFIEVYKKYKSQGLEIVGISLDQDGWDAINPGTGAAKPNWTEYDLTLDYRFAAKSWPEWARPFWIRGRAAYVDQRSDGNVEDYRIIVNYDWKF